MKTSHILAACGALALVLQITPAAADDAPWYFGIAGGATRYNVPGVVNMQVAATPNTPAYHFTSYYRTSAAAYRFEGGYRLTDYFAVEGSYTDFGAIDTELTVDTPLTFSDHGHIRVRAWTVDGVGTWPVTSWLDLFGRAGLAEYHSDFTTVTLDVQSSPTPTITHAGFAEDSANGSTLMLGAGVNFNITDGFTLRAGWDYLQGKSFPNYMPSLHLLSAEAVFRFH